MEIKPPSTDLYTAMTRHTSATTQSGLTTAPPPNWKIEQLLQAIITKITEKQLFLEIQGIKANTLKPTGIELQVGDTLKLQIEQLKPMPQFRIISFDKMASNNIVSQMLRNSTVQNSDVTHLLKNISYVASRPALRPSPLSAEVNAAVRDIFKQLPAPFNLKNAPQVKNQLHDSGIFLENKIKNQLFSHLRNNETSSSAKLIHSHIRSELASDLGAQLHRLASLIKTQISSESSTAPQNLNRTNQNINASVPAVSRSPAEQASLQNITVRDEAMQSFLRQVESSLTHMQQTQLQNLNESQAGRPLWLMELPIKNGQDIDLFELRITEEESQEAEGENKKIWNVTLQFNLSGLGKIKAHIKMQNEIVSTQFFSEKTEVLSLFQDNFDFLRSRFNLSGLNVGSIECSRANLSVAPPTSHSTPLDERT